MSLQNDGVEARPIRLAELLVAFSAVADLGMGLPVGSAARTAGVAIELARACGCPESAVADAYYAALLQHIGCSAFSHEVAAWFTDEMSIKRAGMSTDFTRKREIVTGYLPRITRDAPPGGRFKTLRAGLVHAQQMTDGYTTANCEVAGAIAERLGLPPGVRLGLLDIFERWNGSGGPKGTAGESIAPTAQLVNIAGYGVFFDNLGGIDAAVGAVRQRAGSYFDPSLCERFTHWAEEWLGDAAAGGFSDRLLDAEPHPYRMVPVEAVDTVLQTFGEAVDLKSPYFHGHSAAVSRLADNACRRLGLDDPQVMNARRAGLVQDIGRVAVPSGIWEHTGPLGSDAWMQVRLHAYHGEQILARCEPLRELAPIAGMHHDRLDGSGYHRSATASQIPMTSRVLAVADAYHALTSSRPHRPAYSAERAAQLVGTEASAGRLDHDAVTAVCAAARDAPIARRQGHAGLTERQIAVLRLMAAGRSNKQISVELVISPRTAERHVQDVYARIGVSSRAAAALYGMHHGLL